MDNDRIIKVPTELGRTLDRMGLPEYKLIQVDPDGAALEVPEELGRILLRMGGDYKEFTDSDFVFKKATSCADTSIEEIVLANQSYIKNVSQVGNDCTINVEVDELQNLTSPVTHLTKKYVCMLIRTSFDTIVGAKWGGKTLTATDVQDSIDMGGTAQDICWWVDAESIVGNKLSQVVSKENYATETLSIECVDVSKFNLTYTDSEGNITAVFTGRNSRVITPGDDVVDIGEAVVMTLTATNDKFIGTVTVGGESVSVGSTSFTAEIVESASANIAVTVTELAGVTLSYNANDASAVGTVNSQTVATGYSAVVAQNGFEVESKSFVKWNTASDGSGTDYLPEASITMNSDLQLYAIWE